MNDATPAFPSIVQIGGPEVHINEGLTVRAYVATKIMASFYSIKGSSLEDARGLAPIAVKAADALIAELNK